MGEQDVSGDPFPNPPRQDAAASHPSGLAVEAAERGSDRMSEPVNPDPSDDSDEELPPPPDKQPDDDPPMEPNPYMGGGTAPT
jgi:hypothetical protein